MAREEYHVPVRYEVGIRDSRIRLDLCFRGLPAEIVDLIQEILWSCSQHLLLMLGFLVRRARHVFGA